MRFKVKVKVWAESTYEVEVDEASERKAEEAAVRMWRDLTGTDFQVDKIDGSECETEQLTFKCQECGVQIFPGQLGFEDFSCPTCQSAWLTEEAEYKAKQEASHG